MWFIVVAFLSFNADGSQNLFVFTDPTFENFEQCQEEVLNPIEQPKYIQRLLFEYNGSLPGMIDRVSCVPRKAYNELLKMKNPGGVDT